MSGMNPREFITLVGGTAAAWPLKLRAHAIRISSSGPESESHRRNWFNVGYLYEHHDILQPA